MGAVGETCSQSSRMLGTHIGVYALASGYTFLAKSVPDYLGDEESVQR